VLTRLLIMYSLSSILDDPQWNGLLNSAQIRLIKQAVIDIMEQLRPDAVALVDAFDFPDRVLNSAIGRYDGNIRLVPSKNTLNTPPKQMGAVLIKRSHQRG